MKETIRTASILEIYNEAIKELNSRKQKLQVELTSLQGKDVAIKGGKFVLKLVGIILIIFGIFASLAGIIAVGETNGGSVILVLLGFFIVALGSHLIMRSTKKGKDIFDRMNNLKQKISDINKEIEDRKTRKKSLLEAEAVIVSKDMKTDKLSLNDEEPTVPFNAEKKQIKEKDCPMCAETVKYAAKICRFCGYKFEEL